LQVVTGFFDTTAADEIRERAGLADVVTGSNAFAHNEEPERILEADEGGARNPRGICAWR